MMKNTLLLILSIALFSCATPPPKHQDNACNILGMNRSWYKATRATEKKWGTPIALQLAFIKQESSFKHNAKPARQGQFLLVFPGARASSAQGYAQALDQTWREYQQATRKKNANRRNFKDATDFIGWYTTQAHKRAGIPKADAYRHYLAYHQGIGGYMQGTHKIPYKIRNVARKVAATANQYERQLDGCKRKFQRNIPLLPLL